MKRIEVLSLPLDVPTRDELLARIEELLDAAGGHNHVIALNPLKIMSALRHPDLHAAISRASVVYADAVGVCWAGRYLHGVDVPRIPGFLLFYDILALAARSRRRVYLLGSTTKVVETAGVRLEERYPGLQIVGTHHGFFDAAHEDTLVEQVRAAAPDVMFVAMGFLLQERWIERLRQRTAVRVYMGVGGSLDVVAGAGPGAPQWVSDRGLLWLYRLLKQPHRAREMTALPRFVLAVLAQKRMMRRNG